METNSWVEEEDSKLDMELVLKHYKSPGDRIITLELANVLLLLTHQVLVIPRVSRICIIIFLAQSTLLKKA